MRAQLAALLLASCAVMPESHEFSWLSGCFNDGRETWRWQQQSAVFWRMRAVRANQRCDGTCEFYLSKGRDGVWRFETVDSDQGGTVYQIADLRSGEAVFIGQTPRGRPQPDWALTLRERDGVLTITDSTITSGPVFSGNRTECAQ